MENIASLKHRIVKKKQASPTPRWGGSPTTRWRNWIVRGKRKYWVRLPLRWVSLVGVGSGRMPAGRRMNEWLLSISGEMPRRSVKLLNLTIPLNRIARIFSKTASLQEMSWKFLLYRNVVLKHIFYFSTRTLIHVLWKLRLSWCFSLFRSNGSCPVAKPKREKYKSETFQINLYIPLIE